MWTFLKGYTDNFQAALLLWPLVSFLLTLPILAVLYRRDGRLRIGSALATYLAVLYFCGLACFTLYPLPQGESGPGITYGIPPQFNPLNFIFDIQRDGMRAVFQLLFNVVLFVPFGFIARRLMRLGAVPTVLLALGVSCLIETAQLTGLFGIYPYAYRTFEVDDMITNTLGGLVGWLGAKLLGRILPAAQASEEDLGATTHPGFVRRCVAFWIDMTLVGVCALLPWVLLSVRSELMAGVAFALPALDAPHTAGILMTGCAVVAFLAVQVAIPWFANGQTPGGMFVRMTFETRTRTRAFRLLFYAARITVIAFVIACPLFCVPPLALFYAFVREMPYDLIPGTERPEHLPLPGRSEQPGRSSAHGRRANEDAPAGDGGGVGNRGTGDASEGPDAGANADTCAGADARQSSFKCAGRPAFTWPLRS